MKILGLTGGIACGKSTVSKTIIEHNQNVRLVDADLIARSALDPGTAPYKIVVQYFDQYRDPETKECVNILNDDKTINRVLLGKIVFQDKETRKMINKATHWHITKKMLHQVFSNWTIRDYIPCLRTDKEIIVLVDAPLLYETYWFTWLCSKIIVIETSFENQLHWLIERNNLSEIDAKNRINAQMPLSKKVAKADYVISNRSSLESLIQETDRIFKQAAKGATTFGMKFLIASAVIVSIIAIVISIVH
jgi:dephospho-CoA kinase